MKKKISVSIDNELLNELNSLIDGKTIRNRSQAIEYLIRKNSESSITTGVILAGGPKERLVYRNTFKPLAKYNGTPLILNCVRRMEMAGITKIYIISSEIINEISKILSNENISADISFISDDSHGTSGALYKLKRRENVLVASGDVYFDFDLRKLIKFHMSSKATATVAVTTTDVRHSKDSIFIEGTRIVKFEYKPKKPSFYSNAGIYAFRKEIFDFIKPTGSLERDVFPKLAELGKMNAYLISGEWFHAD